MKKEPQSEVAVFLMADSVVAAKAGQKTPQGYYNVELMLKPVLAGNGKILLCGACMDPRGLRTPDCQVCEGCQHVTMLGRRTIRM